jgi:hypothetical protein
MFKLLEEGKYDVIQKYSARNLFTLSQQPSNIGLTTLHECIVHGNMDVRWGFQALH